MIAKIIFIRALWTVVFLLSLTLFLFGPVYVGMFLGNFLLGSGVYVLGWILFCLWMMRDLQTKQLQTVFVWIVFQLLAPAIPLLLAIVITIFAGAPLNWIRILSGAEAYLYVTYLGVAGISVLAEALLSERKSDFPVGMLAASFLLTFLAGMVTGSLIERGVVITSQDSNLTRPVVLLFLFSLLLPLSIGARIKSL